MGKYHQCTSVLLYADAMENYWLAHAPLSGDKTTFDEPEEILGADTENQIKLQS
jgi:hypothetical protein